MKKLNKFILISSFTLFLICPLFIPISKAQEWVYDGVDTENIPNHSVYPSEWYVFAQTLLDPEILSVGEISHGNITDIGPGPGYCAWGNGLLLNITSGETTSISNKSLISYWNETIGFIGGGSIIPVELDGMVSDRILSNISLSWETSMLSSYIFEHKQRYLNTYSLAFWNETYNSAYIHFNYTNDGILAASNCYLLPFGNLSLYSQPAQLPPVFSFAPEQGLIVNSTTFILDIDIAAADNNNDGVTDTDYLMRHFQGSSWTSWGTPPNQLLWSIGSSAPSGNYTITIEVRNMYGVTQEQIEVQYVPPSDDETPIPGYPTLFIAIAISIAISYLILKNRIKK